MKYTPEFERFWAAYPLKIGKRHAAKMFERALKEVTLQELIDGAQRYAAWMLQPEQAGRSYCHGGTWLNEARWEDEYPMPADRATGWARQREGLNGPKLAVDNG